MVIKRYQMLDLRSLYEELEAKKMEVGLAYKFLKLGSILDSELKIYEIEMQKILDEYGEKDENNELVLAEDKKSVIIKEDLIPKCKEDLDKLYDFEIEIKDLSFCLEEIEKLEVTLQQMRILMPLLEE